MKYKVIHVIPGSASDSGVNFSFYTLNGAQSYAQAVVTGLGVSAYLWDGIRWTTYS